MCFLDFMRGQPFRAGVKSRPPTNTAWYGKDYCQVLACWNWVVLPEPVCLCRIQQSAQSCIRITQNYSEVLLDSSCCHCLADVIWPDPSILLDFVRAIKTLHVRTSVFVAIWSSDSLEAPLCRSSALCIYLLYYPQVVLMQLSCKINRVLSFITVYVLFTSFLCGGTLAQ